LSDDGGFDPYDDNVPISARMGMQRLGEPAPLPEFDPDLRPDADPELVDPKTGVVSLSNRRKKTPATTKTTPFQPVGQPNSGESSESRWDRREWASTGLEIVGLAAFSAGFFMLYVWLGLIVTGVCLVALGVATSDRFTRPPD